MSPDDLEFETDGVVLHRAVLALEAIEALRAEFEPLINGRPGRRLSEGNFTEVVAHGVLSRIAAQHAGSAARPVRVVIFDKTPDTNWSVAWHQDRTIPIRNRIDADGFGPWSVKDGLLHVEPPVAVLKGMVTLRLHLDDCGPDNAPLKVALGSHNLGRVAAGEAANVASAMPIHNCLAKSGDVWACATLILHASERSYAPTRRRVLQIDYAAKDLPGGLEWRGLD